MKNPLHVLLGMLVQGLIANSTFGQLNTGVIYGTVMSELKEAMPVCTIVLLKDSEITTGIITDTEGNFIIGNVEPGLYDLKISSIGFSSKYISEILIDSSEVNLPPIELKWGVNMSSVVCSANRPSCDKPCGYGCICECCVPPVDFIGKESESNRDVSVSVDTTSFLALTSWHSQK